MKNNYKEFVKFGYQNGDFIRRLRIYMHSDNFKIRLHKNGENKLSERMKNSNEIFHLEKKYNHSKEYVKEIMRKRYIYSETTKDILLKNFAEILVNEKQIVETLYLYSDSEEYMHNRSLSKLTKDILLK